MPNRIEELFAELAESAGGQQQFQIDQQLRQQEAERELYDTDEARTALKIMGGLLTLGIPLPGMRALGLGKLGSQVPGLNKLYGAVGGDMAKQAIKNKQPVFEFSKKINDYVRRQKNADEKMMFEKMSIRNRIKNDPPLSGSRVGTDVAGRVPLPTAKPPVTTIRGPRGPLLILDNHQQVHLDLPLPKELETPAVFPMRKGHSYPKRGAGGTSPQRKQPIKFTHK